jgi:hypothetical protein
MACSNDLNPRIYSRQDDDDDDEEEDVDSVSSGRVSNFERHVEAASTKGERQFMGIPDDSDPGPARTQQTGKHLLSYFGQIPPNSAWALELREMLY